MGTDQDSVTYTAHLDLQGVTTVTGVWTQGREPQWNINKSLSETYRNDMREVIQMSWREVGGHFTPHDLGTMIACLEVTSTKLSMRMIVPTMTAQKLLSLSALAS